MDHTWLAAVTMHTTNLILVPKINWWFVFIILICGRRERSKKNHFMHLRTAIYENWNNITSSTKNNHQPKCSRHSFYFLYGTKPRKSMTGLKRQICWLIKRSNIRGKKPYSDHNIAVIILENKTQKKHCYICVAMVTKVGKVI